LPLKKENIPYIPYAVHLGPTRRDVDSVLAKELPVKENDPGMNCQLYTSLVVRSMGTQVPNYYRSEEWFTDPDDVLQTIDPIHVPIQTGDVLGFVPQDIKDKKKIHVGVAHVGERGVRVVHASREAGRVIVTPINRMPHNQNHKRLAMVRRPNVLDPDHWNHKTLVDLGFMP
jgi:hypothetical protein